MCTAPILQAILHDVWWIFWCVVSFGITCVTRCAIQWMVGKHQIERDKISAAKAIRLAEILKEQTLALAAEAGFLATDSDCVVFVRTEPKKPKPRGSPK